MDFHIHRDGQQLGPFSLDEIRSRLASGSLSLSDFAWYDGAADWMPLSSIALFQPSSAAPPASQTAKPEDVKPPAISPWKYVCFTLSGMILPILTAVVCAKFGWTVLISLTFMFIIPLGVKLNMPKSRFILVNMVLGAIVTFFVLHYYDYMNLVIDHQAAHTFVSFPRYLDIVLRHQTLKLGDSEIGEIGAFGYLYALLEIAGLGLGGLAVYVNLSDKKYCNECSLYYRKVTAQSRSFSTLESLVSHAQTMLGLLAAGSPDVLLARHAESGDARQKGQKAQLFSSGLTVTACPKCRRHNLIFLCWRITGNAVVDIPALRGEMTYEEQPSS